MKQVCVVCNSKQTTPGKNGKAAGFEPHNPPRYLITMTTPPIIFRFFALVKGGERDTVETQCLSG
jgi:hypothetical protein